MKALDKYPLEIVLAVGSKAAEEVGTAALGLALGGPAGAIAAPALKLLIESGIKRLRQCPDQAAIDEEIAAIKKDQDLIESAEAVAQKVVDKIGDESAQIPLFGDLSEGMWRLLAQGTKILDKVEGIEAILQKLLPRKIEEKDGRNASPSRAYNLPPFPRNQDFVGREAELEALYDQLAPGRQDAKGRPVVLTQPKKSSVTGLGGMGKTQLALEYAYRHLTDYRGILWVDAEGEDITAGMAKLGETLGLDLPAEMPAPEQAELVRKALESYESGAYLLVLDNISRPESYPSHLPRTGSTRVLITTRLPNLQNVKSLEVDRLEPDEALGLLLGERAWPDQEREAAGELCETLGYLTLAVATAGRILKKGVRSPSSLLKSIDDQGPVSWSDDMEPDAVFQKHPSIARLFDTSLALLEEKDEPLRSHAKDVALVGGWFGPVGITQELLLDAAGRLHGQEVETVQGALAMELLVDLGLARPTPEGGLIFHRLVQAFLRDKGGEPAKTAVLDTLASIAKQTKTDTLALLALEPHRFHMETMVDYLSSDSTPEHLRIALRLAQFLKNRAQFEVALVILKKMLGFLREGEWASYFLHEAGQTLDRHGKYDEAMDYYKRALEIMNQTRENKDAVTALTLKAIGQTLHNQGKYNKAMDYYKRALEIVNQTRENKDVVTANTLKAIGQTLHSQGKYDEAMEYFKQALESWPQTMEHRHPFTALTLKAIGQTSHSQGKYDEALEYFKRALEITEQTLGDKHPETAITRFDLGRTLRHLGDDEGGPMMLQAVTDLEEALGPSHPTVKAVRSWL
ncbi:MAG: tetratricopeptide repeat protein [Deltaproteobacteria bacterium]|nr:tetratricopeptide repeat protein [Deltaproteobacteria bacterium]